MERYSTSLVISLSHDRAEGVRQGVSVNAQARHTSSLGQRAHKCFSERLLCDEKRGRYQCGFVSHPSELLHSSSLTPVNQFPIYQQHAQRCTTHCHARAAGQIHSAERLTSFCETPLSHDDLDLLSVSPAFTVSRPLRCSTATAIASSSASFGEVNVTYERTPS